MRIQDTNDAETLALAALGWALREPTRAQRLLALTGLTPEDLRDRIGDPETPPCSRPPWAFSRPMNPI
jgi:hypothetical protein